MRRYFCLLILFLSCLPFYSYGLTLKETAPVRYVVKPGDTLWSIASQYLSCPWEWKSLWRANPDIKNPNHLHIGDVILLKYADRNPFIKILSHHTVKLSPYIRTLPLDDAIPTIPLSEIRPFFDGSLILDKNSLKNAPYIVAFTLEHLLASQGDEVYVKNLCPKRPPPGMTHSYAIYRSCGKYISRHFKCPMGYKARLVGYAELVRGGDPAKLVITDITEGIELGDKVMPNNYPNFDVSFLPKVPKRPVFGEIIEIPGDFTIGAVGLVAIINRGKDAGLEPGDVLAIYEEGKSVKPEFCLKCVKLPPERVGEVMIFRTFTHSSFGLVMRSIRAIQVTDKVTNP